MAKQWKSLFEYYGFTKKDEKKYPVVSRILKQLTPERIKKELIEIQKVKLPPELQKWVREYERVGERNEFIWKWTYKSSQVITLSVVPKKYQRLVWESKVLIFMLDTLLDDIADRIQGRALLTELLKVPFEQSYIEFNHLNRKEKKYLLFTKKLWSYIEETIRGYPRYKEFKDILAYDIAQLLNAMTYASLVNKVPYLINKTEFWMYLSHNMAGVICGTVDLMSVSKVDIRKLGILREISWEGQQMARIGNWVSTWEREINEKDFTSGVIAYAIDSGVITTDELEREKKSNIIKKIKNSKIEKKLLKEWEKHYRKIEKITRMKKTNIKKILSGLEKFIVLHLATRGYK